MFEDFLTLGVGADELDKCAEAGLSAAPLIYRIDEGRVLRRLRSSAGRPGDILPIICPGEKSPDTARLAGDVLGEVERQNYEAVLIEYGGGKWGADLAKALAPELDKKGLTLYTHPEYVCEGSTAVERPRVTEGSFRLYIQQLIAKRGGRVAIELVPMYINFALPDESGGKDLTADELHQLMSNHPDVYYSRELAVKYFTYHDGPGITHIVLFDDAYTLRNKLRSAQAMGAMRAFMLYHEAAPFLKEILSSDA